MKQVEKLDILLRTLYGCRYEGYYPLTQMWIQKALPMSMKTDLVRLITRLKNDDLVDVLSAQDEYFAQITEKGIAYCERDSYTYRGFPLLTNQYGFSFPDTGQVL